MLRMEVCGASYSSWKRRRNVNQRPGKGKKSAAKGGFPKLGMRALGAPRTLESDCFLADRRICRHIGECVKLIAKILVPKELGGIL